MSEQTRAERVDVMLGIFTDPETDGLDTAQLTDHLRAFVRANTREGIFESRSLVPQFMTKLVRWLALDLGVTDQQLFERLSELAEDASDEYCSWSPEYSFPISNREARDFASFESWDDLIFAINDHPSTHEGQRLASEFYVAFGPGELDWIERNGQSFSGDDYPKFLQADWARLREQAVK